MSDENKNVINDRDLRIAAISNYVYYLEHLSDSALDDEYERSKYKANLIDALFCEPEPEPDEHRPDSLFD